MVCFASRDLGAAEPAGHHYFNAADAKPHSPAHSVFHRAAKTYALFKLCGNPFCNELRVRVRVFYLDYRKSHRLADPFFDVLAQPLDLRAAFADNYAGAGAMDKYPHLGVVALDFDPRNTG